MKCGLDAYCTGFVVVALQKCDPKRCSSPKAQYCTSSG